MRADLSSGDRSSAEQVYVSHVKALEQLDLDEIAPTTLQLWDEIVGRASYDLRQRPRRATAEGDQGCGRNAVIGAITRSSDSCGMDGRRLSLA